MNDRPRPVAVRFRILKADVGGRQQQVRSAPSRASALHPRHYLTLENAILLAGDLPFVAKLAVRAVCYAELRRCI
jgi:hypothetical protein